MADILADPIIGTALTGTTPTMTGAVCVAVNVKYVIIYIVNVLLFNTFLPACKLQSYLVESNAPPVSATALYFWCKDNLITINITQLDMYVFTSRFKFKFLSLVSNGFSLSSDCATGDSLESFTSL